MTRDPASVPPVPRAPLDLSLYLVTDTRMTQPLGLRNTVRAAIDGGVTLVQLRDKNADDEEFVALGRLIHQALKGTGVPLIINDRIHLVEAIGAEGAHIGQDDTSPLEAREVLGPTAYLGLSCSRAEHVEAANALPAGVLDYFGIGSAWPTRTKLGHPTPLGREGVDRLAALSALPTVAIGGIDAYRAGVLASTAVDGVAVVSAICTSFTPASAARQIATTWKAHR